MARPGSAAFEHRVNLTPRQFCDESLLADMTAILEAANMDPHLLEIEITESLLIHDVDSTLRILRGLKDLGIRIAVDDFGTGYSSLAMLQRFPLDTIKIDRSFMRNIAGTAQDTGLADAIIAMGKSLSLTVVALGVETEEQANICACTNAMSFRASISKNRCQLMNSRGCCMNRIRRSPSVAGR